MGKTTGLGAGCWVDGYDLSNDVGALSRINSARGVTEVPGIDVEAQERVHTLRDGGFEWSSWWNAAADQEHAVLKGVPSTDRIATYLHRKSLLGASAAAMVCKQFSYDTSRPTDASQMLTVVAESNQYGVEWGQLLTPGKRTDTTATNGAAVDMEGAATSFGLQAYLHVFAFTGTSVTVKLQMDDNSGFTTPTDVTGGGFSAVSAAHVAQRIETARNLAVERYLRVVTTGTFSNAVFGVIVKRNQVNTVFKAA